MDLALLFFLSPAFAETPRVVAADEGVEVAGLPALSGDGTLVAMLEPFEASSDASRTSIRFVRVKDGVQVDRWVVLEDDDAGHRITDTSDGRGTTAWRRAKNLTAHLREGGYRALEVVGEWNLEGPVQGAGLRITSRRGEVIVREVRDRHVRWSGRLPGMRAFCGMSDDHPRDVPPRVHGAWVDERRTTLLLVYGHVYGSCMCPSDLASMIVPLLP